MSGSKFLPMDVPLTYTARDISRELQASSVSTRHAGCSRPRRTAPMLCGPSLYQPTREKKVVACEAALQILPRILPQEQWASTFHVWLILASGYKHMLEGNIKPAFDAVMCEESETSDVLSASLNLFEVGEAYCLGSIAALESSLIQFSEVELAKIQEDVEKTTASMNAMNVIKDALGPLFPEKGCVRPDQYDDSKAALRRVKHQVVEDFSSSSEDRRIWEEVWPFDD